MSNLKHGISFWLAWVLFGLGMYKTAAAQEPIVSPTAKAVIPRSYALVIGVSKYKNLGQSAQLAYPDHDARDMYSTLISADGGQFPRINVHRLIDEDATEENIRRELEVWLPSVTTDDDRVFIYFAGHGFIANTKGYLAPYDLDLRDIDKSAYPMATLEEDVEKKIKGKWKVLVTDACHAGALTQETNIEDLNRQLLRLNRSLFSLTASRSGEKSREGQEWGGGHGIFTYYVIKGLEGEADENGDGVVSADELAEYVHSNVRTDTHAAQNPTAEWGSFDPEMVLAYNPDRARVKPTAPKFGTLIIESAQDDTEVWLNGKTAGVVNKDAPLRLPGIEPGAQTLKAMRLGYEPDGPKEIQVYPGQETAVSIRVDTKRRHNPSAADSLENGINFYKRGSDADLLKAIDEFKHALSVDANYEEVFLYMGLSYEALVEAPNAFEAFENAIKIDPEYFEARVAYAGALLHNGRLDDARHQLEETTERHPENAMAWYLLSQSYARAGEYKSCQEAAVQAILQAPNNAAAHFFLAECSRQLRQGEEAKREYRSAINLLNSEINGGEKDDLQLSGYLFGSGRVADKSKVLRELRGQVYVGICDSEYLEKRLGEAIPACEQALNYLPNDRFANYRLAILYVEEFNSHNSLEMLAAAKSHFVEVVRAAPDTKEAERAAKYVANIDSVLEEAAKSK